MGSKEFVWTTNQEIGSQLIHIDDSMRGKVNGIDKEQGLKAMHLLGYLRDWIDRSKQIRSQSDGNNLRSLIQNLV